jgi:hypothetical protein
MRQEFYSTFSLLSRDYVSRVVGRRAVPILDILRQHGIPAIVESAIASAEQRLPKGKVLRPDARHFLLVNLIEMVAAPLMVSRDRFLSGQVQPSFIELAEDLQHDTSLITQAASDITNEEQVSSNSLVRALAGSFERLRLNRYEVWG